MKTIMGTSEAARLTGFSPRRIREMLADGVLGGVRIDGKWVVTQQAIVRFLLPGGSSEEITRAPTSGRAGHGRTLAGRRRGPSIAGSRRCSAGRGASPPTAQRSP